MLRKLWNHNLDPAVSEACSGIKFESPPSSAVDSIIDSITDKRASEAKLKKYSDSEIELVDLIKSILSYSIPWLVLFILTLIITYFLYDF